MQEAGGSKQGVQQRTNALEWAVGGLVKIRQPVDLIHRRATARPGRRIQHGHLKWWPASRHFLRLAHFHVCTHKYYISISTRASLRQTARAVGNEVPVLARTGRPTESWQVARMNKRSGRTRRSNILGNRVQTRKNALVAPPAWLAPLFYAHACLQRRMQHGVYSVYHTGLPRVSECIMMCARYIFFRNRAPQEPLPTHLDVFTRLLPLHLRGLSLTVQSHGPP